MSKPAKPTFIILMMILTLVMSLVFPLSVLADDGLPPEEPGTSEGEVAETEEEVPPGDNSTEETSEGEAAVLEDEAVEEVTTSEDELVEEGEDEADAADEEIVEEQPSEENIPEALEAMEDAGVILADENGNPLPLVTEAVEDALLFPDPIGCPPGVQPVTWGGTGAGCTASYSSIQAAIDDVSVAAGWTIYIDPGTFVENVVVNKSVALQGSGMGVTIIQPAISGPTCAAGSICAGSSNVILVQADNVTIRDLTVDGNNPSLNSGVFSNGVDVDARNGIITDHTNGALGVIDGLEVDNVEVKNIYLRGIYASDGGTFNIHDSVVDNVNGEYLLTCPH